MHLAKDADEDIRRLKQECNRMGQVLFGLGQAASASLDEEPGVPLKSVDSNHRNLANYVMDQTQGFGDV